MSGGLVGTGESYQNQAQYGLEQVAGLELRRKQQTQANKTSRVQSEASLAGTGAALGSAAAGAEAGGVSGPWGAVIGGVVGLLAGALM